jgi:hypothetical protein
MSGEQVHTCLLPPSLREAFVLEITPPLSRHLVLLGWTHAIRAEFLSIEEGLRDRSSCLTRLSASAIESQRQQIAGFLIPPETGSDRLTDELTASAGLGLRI